MAIRPESKHFSLAAKQTSRPVQLLAATSFLSLSVAGCASPWSTNTPRLEDSTKEIPLTTVTLIADWNDLAPALLIAASRSQLGLAERSETTGIVVAELFTIHDETMHLVVTPQEPITSRPIKLKLEAHLLPVRDTTREKQFLQALSKRLTQLKGVDTAPVD